MNKYILPILFIILIIVSCKEKKKEDTISKPKVEITKEKVYVVGLFEGQVRACVGCDGYQSPNIWVTPITEFESLSTEEQVRQMDKWESKLRKLFGGIKILDRDALIYSDYVKISEERRRYLNAENATSTESLIGF
jgi:hypothetical protein